MIVQPYQLYVERRDATKNMSRFYALSIEPTLFGEACLVRRWGRIGARGQTMMHHFQNEEDAVELFLALLRQKRRRGYRPLSALQLSAVSSPSTRRASEIAIAPIGRLFDTALRSPTLPPSQATITA